jgi:hypothetical protein
MVIGITNVVIKLGALGAVKGGKISFYAKIQSKILQQQEM